MPIKDDLYPNGTSRLLCKKSVVCQRSPLRFRPKSKKWVPIHSLHLQPMSVPDETQRKKAKTLDLISPPVPTHFWSSFEPFSVSEITASVSSQISWSSFFKRNVQLVVLKGWYKHWSVWNSAYLNDFIFSVRNFSLPRGFPLPDSIHAYYNVQFSGDSRWLWSARSVQRKNQLKHRWHNVPADKPGLNRSSV